MRTGPSPQELIPNSRRDDFPGRMTWREQNCSHCSVSRELRVTASCSRISHAGVCRQQRCWVFGDQDDEDCCNSFQETGVTNKAGTFAGEQLLARFSIHSGSISGLQSGENWRKSGQN